MQYLILQRFRSYGKTLEKGTIVDAEMIRSPRLRQSEGKIIAAVSSSEVPVESGTEEPTPQVTTKEMNKSPQTLQLKLSV